MNYKRVLIIGDANSFLLNDIVYNVNKKYGQISFDILNTNPKLQIIDKNLYSKIVSPGLLFDKFQRFVSSINKYAAFFSMRYYMKYSLKSASSNYDFVHIHFFNKNFLYINPKHIQNITRNLVISFWGSDFYKRSSLQKQKMIPYLDIAKEILFGNPQMRDSLVDYYNNYFSKTRILPIGLEILSSIDNEIDKFNSNKELKNDLGFSDKTVITIGYSSHPDQHQIEIIELITKSIDSRELDRIHFVFPLTYGDQNYKEQIIYSAKKHGLSFTALTKPLSKDIIAKYRIASDIMVHLRDTDQFSGSFQEYLYTGNVVITGNWLPYQFIIDKGIYLHSLGNIDELSTTLNYVLVNLNTESEKTIGNKRIIAEISHWNVLVEKHFSVYYPET